MNRTVRMQGYWVRLLSAIVPIVVASWAVDLFFTFVIVLPSFALHFLYAGTVLAGGVLLSREIAMATTAILKPRLCRNSLVIGNVISVTGAILAVAGAELKSKILTELIGIQGDLEARAR